LLSKCGGSGVVIVGIVTIVGWFTFGNKGVSGIGIALIPVFSANGGKIKFNGG
jgi:hypothetical protein